VIEPGRSEQGPVAYVMSRFPKLTETFILFEILALERVDGERVEVYPLLRQHDDVAHAEALDLSRRVHYLPFLSPAIIASQLRELTLGPRRYLGALGAVISGTWRSANYLLGGLATFPKVVHMARQMRAANVRHVHCHFANHPAAAGLVIHRLTGIPFSFTAHGSDLHVDRTMLCQKVHEAASVFTVSEYNRRLIIETCGALIGEGVEVIHAGVDTSAISPVDRSGRDGPFEILCIGSLTAVKGQAHLLRACRLLVDRGCEIRCRFIGVGPNLAPLERLARDLGIDALVEFEGARPRPKVVEALHRADVLVAPSVRTKAGRREGIPVVLMEAMSAGLPVVASRISGIPELVLDGVNGLLVPPGRAEPLADALVALTSDPGLRDRLGQAGRQTVVRDFDVVTNALRLRDRWAA
jgi:colanic acid/amylovoran biosynthesis glycosyltransferase